MLHHRPDFNLPFFYSKMLRQIWKKKLHQIFLDFTTCKILIYFFSKLLLQNLFFNVGIRRFVILGYAPNPNPSRGVCYEAYAPNPNPKYEVVFNSYWYIIIFVNKSSNHETYKL